MTNDPEPGETGKTIDADFEPAPAADYVVPPKTTGGDGPGWLPVGLIGLVSAVALGVAAMSLGSDEAADNTDVQAAIEALQSSQAEIADNFSNLKTAADASEQRMAEQLEALLTGDEQNEGLEALVAELQSVSDRLDEASLGGADDAQLEALAERIQVLEEADDGEPVSPRQMNRAVTAMRKRVDQLEEENKAVSAQLETRAEALAALTARIEDLEFALQDAGSTTSPAQADLLANLQAEMEKLKTTVERTEDIDIENDRRFSDMLKNLQSVGEAEEKAVEAESAATAALAVSRIEAAAREGRSFHAAYKQLEQAMPNIDAVKALEPIAKSGAPTLLNLKNRFASDRVAALETYDDAADDGWGWTRQVFGSGVKVRKSGEDGGPKALLDKAEDALAEGKLSVAIEAVEGLPVEARGVMADWTASARSRATLEEALSDIGVQLIGRDR